eukprot:3683605-Pleurochrysis_carterae.AAC.1
MRLCSYACARCVCGRGGSGRRKQQGELAALYCRLSSSSSSCITRDTASAHLSFTSMNWFLKRESATHKSRRTGQLAGGKRDNRMEKQLGCTDEGAT